MLFELVKPMKRKGSNNHYFTKRIPLDVAPSMVGLRLDVPIGDKTYSLSITNKTNTIRISLRVNDPKTVKIRQAALVQYFEELFDSLRTDGPIALSHRQTVALSKAVYEAWSADPDPSLATALEADEEGNWHSVDTSLTEIGLGLERAQERLVALSSNEDATEIEATIGSLIDRVLLRNGIAQVDNSSRDMLRVEFLRALQGGVELQAGKALRADYTAPSRQFPDWEPPNQTSARNVLVPLQGLVEEWWGEAELAGRSESTIDAYRRIFRFFSQHVGHDDATRVTQEDVNAFKNARLKSGISPRTFKDGDLSGLRSVFGWAVDNNRLPINPALGVKVVTPRKVQLRANHFTPQEISALLVAATLTTRGKREPVQRWAGRRWVPWLCAYSGARVGEIVQLRKEDVSELEGYPVIRITPEAGRVKDGDARLVPLHPHLLELGFMDFIKGSNEGELFMWTGNSRAAWRTAKNKLTEFARIHITDPNVMPNHGWRYTFKTLGLEAGIEGRILDDICGHEPDTVGRAYSPATITTKVKAIGKLPRFTVGD